MADEPAKPPTPKRPIKLEPWQRWILGAIGLVGMGAGGTATFTRDVEAGPAALLALGALFILIGIAGVLPTRSRSATTKPSSARPRRPLPKQSTTHHRMRAPTFWARSTAWHKRHRSSSPRL